MEELEKNKQVSTTYASPDNEDALREKELMQAQLQQMQENNERLLNEYMKSQQEAQLL